MTEKEKTLGQKVDEITNKISEASSKLGEKLEGPAKETKEFAHGIGKWRNHASIETRITTIVGGILIALALWNLKNIIWQLLLLVAGIFLTTGLFDGLVQDGIEIISNWIEIQKDKLNSAKRKKAMEKSNKSESEQE